jgi:hypothetical protein
MWVGGQAQVRARRGERVEAREVDARRHDADLARVGVIEPQQLGFSAGVAATRRSA